jgi:hypothetical protein
MFQNVQNRATARPHQRQREAMMGGKGRRSCRKHRRGATLVEFAIVAPIFFVTVFAIVEFGRAIMVEQILTDAAREGARRAILEQYTPAEVQAEVADFLDSTSVPGASVSVSPEDFSRVGFGDPVTVGVAVPYGQVSWLPVARFLRGATVSSTSTMSAERPE